MVFFQRWSERRGCSMNSVLARWLPKLTLKKTSSCTLALPTPTSWAQTPILLTWYIQKHDRPKLWLDVSWSWHTDMVCGALRDDEQPGLYLFHRKGVLYGARRCWRTPCHAFRHDRDASCTGSSQLYILSQTWSQYLFNI